MELLIFLDGYGGQDCIIYLNSNMELLIWIVETGYDMQEVDLNSNMELLIYTSTSFCSDCLLQFKFQYGATNITCIRRVFRSQC